MPTVVIIGNRADAHAKAVLDALSQYDVSVSILDLETLPQLDYEWSDQGFRTRQSASEKWRSWEEGTRGWIRRISPPFWRAGIAIESVEAAETTAWLALLGGIAQRRPSDGLPRSILSWYLRASCCSRVPPEDWASRIRERWSQVSAMSWMNRLSFQWC